MVFLLTALTGGVLIGCSHVNVNETVSNNPTEISSTFLVEESISIESNLNDKTEGYTESNGMENQEPSMDDDMHEAFSVKDIFVLGSPFEEDRPYMVVHIKDITSRERGRTLKKQFLPNTVVDTMSIGKMKE